MIDSQGMGGSAASAPLVVSGPSESPWLKILQQCLIFVGPVVVLIAISGLIFKDSLAALSAILSGGLVVFFFGISLLIGHLVGQRSAMTMFGAFAIGYVVKFLGFATVLISLGSPEWLERTWFLISALAAVVLWLTVEIRVFSKLRLQIFDDPQPESQDHV